MIKAWVVYYADGEVRTMHMYGVEQAHEFAKANTASNKWAWAHVAQEIQRYDSPEYAKFTGRKSA